MSAPTNSVLERIRQDIVSTLKGSGPSGAFTTANGFQNTVTDVVTPNPGLGNDTVDLRLVVLQGDSAKEEDCPETYLQFLQDFHVICMVVEPEDSTVDIDARLNSLASDVERILCLLRGDTVGHGALVGGQTRGGWAEDTLLDARRNVDADTTSHDGQIAVTVQVRFRVMYNNPMSSIYTYTGA
jgi:hypothetical protein